MKRRAHGEGNIIRRSDGRWEYRASLGNGPGRKRRRVSIYAKTRPELISKIADEKARNNGSLQPRSTKTLWEYLQHWLEYDVRRNRKPATHAIYETVLRCHVMDSLGRERLSRIDVRRVKEFYAHLEDCGVGGATRQKVHIALRSALQTAASEGLIAINPCTKVRRPRHKEAEMQVLTADQTWRLLEAAAGDPLEALYVLAALDGLRMGELFALRWEDIDWAHQRVVVRRTLQEISGRLEIGTPKTKASVRSVDVGAPEIAALRRRQRIVWEQASARKRRNEDANLRRRRKTPRKMNIESPWVFIGPDGELPRRANVRRRSFLPLLERAGLPHIRFHDLRHTAATLMLQAGVHPKVVAARLGHSTVNITLDRYSHMIASLGREAPQAVAGLVYAGNGRQVGRHPT